MLQTCWENTFMLFLSQYIFQKPSRQILRTAGHTFWEQCWPGHQSVSCKARHCSGSEFSRLFWTLKADSGSQWRSFLKPLFASDSHSSIRHSEYLLHKHPPEKQSTTWFVARCLPSSLGSFASEIFLGRTLISIILSPRGHADEEH